MVGWPDVTSTLTLPQVMSEVTRPDPHPTGAFLCGSTRPNPHAHRPIPQRRDRLGCEFGPPHDPREQLTQPGGPVLQILVRHRVTLVDGYLKGEHFSSGTTSKALIA